MTHLPLISVITICRNAEAIIGSAIDSFLACDYPNLEYVVVDGASTDGTMTVLSRHRDKIDTLISEPDEGIADALNKGIAASKGEYHYILHADDRIYPRALRALAEAAGGAPVVSGEVRVMDGLRLVRTFRPVPRLLTEKMSVPHMGTIIRKDVWAEVGGYDKRRRIAMDHLLMLRILRRHGVAGFRAVPATVAEYHVGGLSDRLLFRGYAEVRDNLLEEGYGRIWAWFAFWKLYAKGIISRLLGFIRART
jgi:glycosyltransferase involved in cell wall biosynthesis